jgi:TFIIF-interacting CTD phosphatase-like protein
MAQVPDPSFWQWLSQHLWAPLLGLVAVWWSMLQSRISKVEKAAQDAVTGEEFVGYVARTDKQLDDFRRDVKDIYELFRRHEAEDRTRHDELVAMIHSNHRELLEYMIARKPA